MKKIFKLVALFLVVLFVFSFIKNTVARGVVSAGVRTMTGLKLNMRDMNVSIVRTLIGIKGLRLYNPPGFKDKLMVDMPEIYVDYDLGAFLKRKVHLEKVRINLKEFTVVKNEKGEVNLDSLKVAKEGKKNKPSKEKPKKKPDFQIDVLELKIGKVIYKDYSQGIPPKITEYEVDIDERYENITDPSALASLIITKALLKTAVARLTDFDLGPLKKQTSEALSAARKLAIEGSGDALEIGGELGEKAKDAAEDAAESLKKILPFGE